MQPPDGPLPEQTHVSVRRWLAHSLDSVLFLVAFVVAILAAGALPPGPAADVVLGTVIVLGFTVGQVAFYVALHGRSGRTPGKRLAGIRVVGEDGRPPRRGALVKRSIPLVFEYFTFIAFIAILVSPFRQRLGDRWGRTFVVRNA